MENQIKETKSNPVLKICPVNPSHIWMADINYCPYCTFTPEERINWMRNNPNGKKEKL